MTSLVDLVELQQLYLQALRSAQLVGQRRLRTSTFNTPAESHGALLTTSLASQDISPSLPVSANAVAAQLLRNGKCKGVDRESTRLVSKEVTYRWKTTTATPVDISGDFTAAEFAAAL